MDELWALHWRVARTAEGLDRTLTINSDSDLQSGSEPWLTCVGRPGPYQSRRAICDRTEGIAVAEDCVAQIADWGWTAVSGGAPFNSKLLIAQVLGRGLRVPDAYRGEWPVVTIFNHDAWSSRIKHLVDEVMEVEIRLYSYPVVKSPNYNFTLHQLDYSKPQTIEEFEQKERNRDLPLIDVAHHLYATYQPVQWFLGRWTRDELLAVREHLYRKSGDRVWRSFTESEPQHAGTRHEAAIVVTWFCTCALFGIMS